MPLKNYHLLKGKPKQLELDDDQSPHIEVLIEAAGEKYRIAVNVRSSQSPHALLHLEHDPFASAHAAELLSLPEGLTDLTGGNAHLAFDYVRDNLFERDAMSIAPFQKDGPQNDLRDFIEPELNRGIANGKITVYAFGEAWGPEANKPDQYFNFLPGRGIHDIHMNQGSPGRHARTNGTHQDGLLLLHDSDSNSWSATFLAFQSQSWQTDEAGNAIGPADDPGEPQSKSVDVKIVAALINPAGPEPGNESVTLLNRTDAAIVVDGWSVADAKGRRHTLAGTLAAGDSRRETLPENSNGAQLRNKGGSITLRDAHGDTVDQVKYGKNDTKPEGWSTVF